MLTPTRRRALQWLGSAAICASAGSLVAACQPAGTSLRSPATAESRTPVAPGAASAAAPTPVRMAAMRTIGDAGWMIAVERGYFSQQGMDLSVAELGPQELIAALGSGQLDAGTTGMSAGLFNSVARGVAIRIVGPQARMDPGASPLFFMVRQDLLERGQFSDYRDLKGKKVALIAKGTTGEYVLARALEKGALTSTDVDVVTLDFASMTAGLASRAIDVAVQTEPTATASVAAGVARKWREVSDVAPGLQNSVVLFSADFIARQPELASRWMTAYLQGVRDFHAAFHAGGVGRGEVVSILAKWTPVKDTSLYDRMGFPYIDPNGRVNVDSLRDLLTWFRAQGLVNIPIDVEQVIDPRFAETAVQKLGVFR
jgi:NitT/TauT family transport system substrate-binding protein